MESIALAIYLFAIILIFSCWLITPAKEEQDLTVIPSTSEVEMPIKEEKTEELVTEISVAIPELVIEKVEPIAQEPSEKTPAIDLSAFKTYLLHKNRCIKVKDLPQDFEISQDIKTYNLRGEKVIRVSSLEALLAI